MAPTKKRIDVRKVVQLDFVTNGPAKGWVHTHGLAKFGRPELELRNVPSYFVSISGELLNEIADYMLNDAPEKPVLAGQKMAIGRFTVFKFHNFGPDEKAGYDGNHFEGVTRLCIGDVEMPCQCCPKAKS